MRIATACFETCTGNTAIAFTPIVYNHIQIVSH